MNALFLKDTTVELATRGDSFLIDVPHLILEVTQNDQVVNKVNLLSREQTRGVWHADQIVVLREITADFMVSIFMQVDESDRQLVGFMELNGPELLRTVGKQYEIPLIPHEDYPSLVLRTTGSATEGMQKPVANIDRQTTRKVGRDVFHELVSAGADAYQDFESYGNVQSLDEAILKFEGAAKAVPENDPRFYRVVNDLGGFFTRRFQRLGRLEDLTSAIERFRVAIGLIPDGDPSKPRSLSNLGVSLRTRFERLGDISDLDSAATVQQSAVDLLRDTHPDKPGCLNNLGNSLQTRFERLGNLPDIEGAITAQQAAIKLVPNSHPDKLLYLNNLGISLQKLFGRLGNLEDVNNAVMAQETAVRLTPNGHPRKPMYLRNLGITLQARFERLGDISDLDNAIIALQAAVNLTPDGHTDKPGCLSNLGSSLHRRFERLGNIADIDAAIESQKAALNLTPEGHPDKGMYLGNLGTSLHARFESFGNIEDIDGAITQLRVAVSLTPDGHPHKIMYLSNLGLSLQSRFNRLGDLADIDGAIAQNQATVNLAPDGHPNKFGYLNNLGNSLYGRFERFGNIEDINNATVVQEAAVDLVPDGHPRKPGCLSNLGSTLQTRFERLKNPEDIHNAIKVLQAAVNLTPDDHPDKPSRLNNLGNCLQSRFEQLGNIEDIDNAIVTQQNAVNLTPDGNPEKVICSRNLGTAFTFRFHRFHNPQDSDSAIYHLSIAARFTVGPPTTRFKAVEQWITMASMVKHQSLLQAYECAVGLMPIVAWLGLPMADRHQHLIRMGGIAREAAAAAISLEQYDKALEWLEQGRSIVWNQILQLRTPVDELRSVAPNLADRLIQVSRLIDRGIEHNEGLRSTEEDGQRYRALTSEWESIIEQVRALPNFNDFLKPLKVSRLMDAAQNGPVVVLNIARARCDALVLVDGFDEVVHIPLPDITAKRVMDLRDELKDLLYSSGIRMRGERAAKRLEDDDQAQDCEPILSELWNAVVKPILDSLAFSAHQDVLPRIWWCATGPLAFLPIHAAGIYSPEAVDSQTSDYVISSYTPTLSALLASLDRTPPSTFKLASVIQPSAPGASQIPNTKQELECIKHRLGSRSHIILNDREGTKQRVTKAMSESNWLHLACHGLQRRDEPTKSALILEDGHLTLEEIIKLDLPNAEFAFLSACQTTTGEETLSDEAVHIAGGMLLAGYRGVVATMWSIQDDLAPEVADEFYRRIMEGEGRPDNGKAAEALHYAVERLRKQKGVPLTSWIPFVHLGM